MPAPLFAAEVVPALSPGQHIIDLSQANMIAGAIVGGFGVMAVFVFIGFLLFKSGLRFHFGATPAIPAGAQVVICGDPSKCPDHKAENERSIENKRLIDLLFERVKKMQEKHDGDLETIKNQNQMILLGLVSSKVFSLKDVDGLVTLTAKAK